MTLPSEPDLAALAEAIHETCDWEHYMGHEPSERDDMLAASLLPALERRGWSRSEPDLAPTIRRAVEDSMQDIGLGTDERLNRAAARIAATVLANIDSVKLSEDSLPGEGFDSWADGFRQGWNAAREAATR